MFAQHPTSCVMRLSSHTREKHQHWIADNQPITGLKFGHTEWIVLYLNMSTTVLVAIYSHRLLVAISTISQPTVLSVFVDL